MDTIHISLLHSKYPISYNKKYISQSKLTQVWRIKSVSRIHIFPLNLLSCVQKALKNIQTKFHWVRMKQSNYHLNVVLDLLQENDFLTSVDLQNAYFSTPIHELDQKYLKFVWNGNLYIFVCLCFGITCAPFLFTKILKSKKISNDQELSMIRNWYNQIPYPALKTKREITKYINWRQFTKCTRGKQNEQLFPK